MAAVRPRDLLSDSLLGRLGGTSWHVGGLAGNGHAAPAGGDAAATLIRDIAKLGEAGYLKAALPPEFGGLGCTLRQAACGQRRLARHAPLTALAVSAHLYWTGAAADAYRSGDNSVRWILPPLTALPPSPPSPPQAATFGSPTRGRGASPPARAATGSAAPRCSPR
jgi:hypothetical protein